MCLKRTYGFEELHLLSEQLVFCFVLNRYLAAVTITGDRLQI
jgi:hypothetical protein